MIDACNDISGIVLPVDEVDGKVDDSEQIIGALDDTEIIIGGLNSDGEAVGVIEIEEDISAKVEMDVYLVGRLAEEPTIQGGVTIGNCEEASPYTGDYEVTPHIDSQTMQTRHKYMLDDVLVKAIPYYETSNTYGTTVYIGE